MVRIVAAAPARQSTAQLPRVPDWALALLLIAVPLVAYYPALRAGYIWDDDAHVTSNAVLRNMAGLRRIWVEPTSIPQYYPLTHTVFWIEYHLWGIRPFGYHLVNLLLHIANALLLWRLLRRWGISTAFFAAMLFAIHPIEVETVAWITELKNTLSGFFYLLAFHALWNWCSDSPLRARWFIVGAACFACALLCKTVTSTLPAALLLVLWWKHRPITRAIVLSLLPLLALGFALGRVTAYLEVHKVGAIGPEFMFSGIERVLIAGAPLWFYAGKILWPWPLAFIYPRWPIDSSDWQSYAFPAAALLMAAALWGFRKRLGRGPLVAVLFFAGSLFPALGFVNVYPMKYSFVADHFQYLAGIGLLVLIAESLNRLTTPVSHTLRVAGGAVILGLLSLLTFNQAVVYTNERTLWEDTLIKNPDCVIAHINLGNYLVSAKQDPDLAIGNLIEATRLAPDDWQAQTALGTALMRMGQPALAEAPFNRALRLRPMMSQSHFNLGRALIDQGKDEQAVDEYEAGMLQFAQESPDAARAGAWPHAKIFAPAYGRLAQAAEARGNIALAAVRYRFALQLAPQLPAAADWARRLSALQPSAASRP